MDDDKELDAIRQRLRAEMMGAQAAPAAQAQGAVDVTEGEFAQFVTGGGLVLVDVWAPWCGPCRFLSPIVEEVAREMAGRVKVGKVNSDENPGVTHAFGIQGIPTLLLFSDGRLVDRVTGALPKPQLVAWLQRHAARASGAAGPRR